MTIQANQGPGVSVFGATSAGGGGSTSPGGSSGQVQYNNGGSFGGMAGTSWDDTNRALTLTGATVTTSQPVLNLSQTWNAGAVTFTGLKFNATDTASASGSLLLDLQVGGASKFSVNKSGYGLFPNGAYGSPSIAISTTGKGFYYNTTQGALYTFDGGDRFYVKGANAGVCSGGAITWSSSDASAIEVYLTRGAGSSASTPQLQLGAADVAGSAIAINSVASNQLTLASNHGLSNGAAIIITGTAAPSGTSLNTLYYARNISAAVIELYDTYQNAITTSGTTGRVSVTTAGTSASVRLSTPFQTFQPQSFTGTDIPGQPFIINGSRGTGTGPGGDIIFRSALPSTTGTSQNTLIANLIINGSGGITGYDGTTANTLALRNGTSPQLFRVYSTYTDAATNAFGGIGAAKNLDGTSGDANTLYIGSQKTGAPTALTKLAIQVDGTTRADYNSTTAGVWTFSAAPSAQYVPGYAFSHSYAGAFGYNALATFYAGSTSNNSTIYFSFGHSSAANNSASIGLQFVSSGSSSNYLNFSISGANNLLNIFPSGLVAFSGTTSSFPALKRSSATLQVRLADDSADAAFSAGAATFSGAVTFPANSQVNTSGTYQAGGTGSPSSAIASTGVYLGNTSPIQWSSTGAWNGAADTYLYRDDANKLALRNGTNAQEQRVYASYTSGTNYQRTSIKTLRESSGALSGATYVSTIAIPAYAVLIGVTTRVTTEITGATSYDVGDGTDVDLWGAAIGVTAGSQSRTADFTAVAATGTAATSRTVTLTANGSNFTAGVVEICLHYLTTEAD